MNMKRRLAAVVVVLFFALLAGAASEKKDWKNGTVVVEFVVGNDGRPTKIKIIDATDKKLAASVVEAVSKWQLDKKYAGKKVRQPVDFLDEAPKQ